MEEKDIIFCQQGRKYWLEVKSGEGWVRHGKIYRTMRGAMIAFIMVAHNLTRKDARDYYKWGVKSMEKLKELLDNLKEKEQAIMYELERLRDVHAQHLIPTHEFLDKTATFLGRLHENGRAQNVVRDMIMEELRVNK